MAYTVSINEIPNHILATTEHKRMFDILSSFSDKLFLCTKNNYSSYNMVYIKINNLYYETVKNNLKKSYISVKDKSYKEFTVSVIINFKQLNFRFTKSELGKKNGLSNATKNTERKEAVVRDTVRKWIKSEDLELKRILSEPITYKKIDEVYTNVCYAMALNRLITESANNDKVEIETAKDSPVDIAGMYNLPYTAATVADLHIYPRSFNTNPPKTPEELRGRFIGVSLKDKKCEHMRKKRFLKMTKDEILNYMGRYITDRVTVDLKIHDESLFELYPHENCFTGLSLYNKTNGTLNRSMSIIIGEFDGKALRLRLGGNGGVGHSSTIELFGTETGLGKMKNNLKDIYDIEPDFNRPLEELFEEYYVSEMFDDETNSKIRSEFGNEDFKLIINILSILKSINTYKEQFMKDVIQGAVKTREEFNVVDISINTHYR